MSPWKGRPDSPVYTNLQDLKISQSYLPPLPSSSPLNTHAEWETYKDASGRHFYYNRTTQERTWKPPRLRDSFGRREEKHVTAVPETEVLFSQTHCISHTFTSCFYMISSDQSTHTDKRSKEQYNFPPFPMTNSKYSTTRCTNHHNYPDISEMHDGICR